MSDMTNLLDRLRYYSTYARTPKMEQETMREAHRVITEDLSELFVLRDEVCALRADLAAEKARRIKAEAGHG